MTLSNDTQNVPFTLTSCSSSNQPTGLLNYGNIFDEKTSTVSIKQPGYYYMFLQVEQQFNQSVNMYIYDVSNSNRTAMPSVIRNVSQPLSLSYTYTSQDNTDVIVVDDIRYFEVGSQLALVSRYSLFGKCQITWGGYRLDNIVSPLSEIYSFATFTERVFYGNESNSPVSYLYNLIIVNSSAWNTTSKMYYAPESGIYLLSYNVDLQLSQTQLITYNIIDGSNAPITYELFGVAETDITSGIFLLLLNRGDMISINSVNINNGKFLFPRMTMKGFLYKKVQLDLSEPVWSAWFFTVVRPSGSGPLLLNPHIVMNIIQLKSSIVITIGGIYFLDLQAYLVDPSLVESIAQSQVLEIAQSSDGIHNINTILTLKINLVSNRTAAIATNFVRHKSALVRLMTGVYLSVQSNLSADAFRVQFGGIYLFSLTL